MSYDIRITDTSTGETRVCHGAGEWNDYLWDEGNYACDCNRAIFFARAAGLPESREPCGDGRFVIARVAEEA